MPDEWAATHLQKYCRPGRHSFIGISIGPTDEVVLRCSECGREQIRGVTCSVCTTEGETGAVLIDDSTGERVSGRLCRLCLDEFERLGEIEGWRAERCGGAERRSVEGGD